MMNLQILRGFLFSKVKTRPSTSPGSADVIRVENESGVTAVDNDDEEDRYGYLFLFIFVLK